MKNIINLLLVSVLLITSGLTATNVNAINAQEMKPLKLGHKYKLQSKVLGEEREVWVRLPQGYVESDKHYPVMVVLDGEFNFTHISVGASMLEEYGRMPQSIIVALPNTSSSRMRDLMDNKDNFRQFIKEDLFNFLALNFRINDMRTLYGHSLAGYFTVRVLADDPELFNNYIAASPTLQVKEREAEKKLADLIAKKSQFTQSLYVSLGDPAEEGKSRTRSMNAFVSMLEHKTPKGLNWRYDPMVDQIHVTTGYLSAYYGLSHVFSDYQALAFETVEAFQQAGGMEAVNAYYDKRAKKYGLAPGLSESMYISLGYLFLFEDDNNLKNHMKAAEILAESLEKNPESINSLEAMGRAVFILKDYQHAKALWQKGLKLAEAKNEGGFVAFFKRAIDRADEEMAK